MPEVDIQQEIHRFRERLLDLTNRNPLLNYRKSVRRTIEIIDEVPNLVYQRLVHQTKAFKFDPLPESEPRPEPHDIALRNDYFTLDNETARGETNGEDRSQLILPTAPRDRHSIPSRHTDDRLQTNLSEARFESVLKSVAREAKTAVEETGINYLHLALGMLHWSDKDKPDKLCRAPLVLIPVHLDRKFDGRGGRYLYNIVWTEEDVKYNLCLAQRLKRDFGLRLPAFDPDELPESYFPEVAAAINNQPGWKVEREALIGFFSFHKLLMYEDIAPENWATNGHLAEGTLANRIIAGQANEEGGSATSLYAPDYEIDGNELAESILLPSEADSSQHSALCDIAEGKSLVIEGPPGTGKSQTITNAIAMCLQSGKRVLFVAEKLAALEVVQNKLKKMGLGDFCLELHSDVATPRRVFESLRERLDNDWVSPEKLQQLQQEIEVRQAVIADYLKATEAIRGPYQEPLYELYWRVVEFRSRGIQPRRNAQVDASVDLTRFNGHSQTLKSFVSGLQEFPEPNRSPWWGFRPTGINPNDDQPVAAVLTRLQELSHRLAATSHELIQLGGDSSTWHRPALELDLESLRQLGANPPPPSTSLDYLLNREARLFARNLVDQLQRREALHQNLSNMFLCDFEEGLARSAALPEVLQSPHADLLRESAIPDIESFGVWLTSTLRAVDQLLIHAGQLETLGHGPIRNGHEYETAVYRLQLFRHPAVEDASVVHEDLFLNSATQEFRRGEKTSESLSATRKLLDEAFHLASAPEADEITRIARLIRPHVGSWFRFFNSEYRQGVKELKSFWRPGIGRGAGNWVRKLETLLEYRQEVASFSEDTRLRQLFGARFEGAETNWDPIRELLTWVHTARKKGLAAHEVRQLLEVRDAQTERVSASAVKTAWQALESQFRDDPYSQFLGVDSAELKSLRLDELRSRIQSLIEWIDRLKEAIGHLKQSRIERLGDLMDLREQIAEFRAKSDFLADRQTNDAMLGDWYRGLDTDTENLLNAVDWCDRLSALPLPESARQSIVADSPGQRCRDLAHWIENYRETFESWVAGRKELDQFGTSSGTWLDFEHSLETDFACRDKLQRLQDKINELPAWVNFSRLIDRCRIAGLGDFVSGVLDGEILPEDVAEVYQMTVLNRIAEQSVIESEQLSSFSRPAMENARAEYQRLDRQITELNQARIAFEAAQVNAPAGNSKGKVAEFTEMGLIRHEIQKQQRHCRIRDLLSRAGHAVQALKPCFMMSPLSVAQFIAPESLEFDLVVMDEASQIKPEDALGTILRARQMVIVGDPKQLPPTSFFDRNNDEISDEEATQFDNSESILEAAMKCFQPVRRLRWHYRSQHESLIQFSNHRFYDDDLVVFPSPTADSGRLGIRHHPVPEATFAGGENLVEAEAVADAIVKHVLERPNETLGVGTFNIRQSRLIEELLDKRCDEDSRVAIAVEKFRDQHEDLFIKNLENLQGDERDVIFISYTYGPEPHSGRVMNRFGPINGAAGWRRLNVLITRARRRVEVFSSMRPSQIAGGPDKSRGVNALKDYLEFAMTGQLPERGQATGREPDSPFELSVARVVEAMGLVAVPQVGVAGYFIDLGIRERDGNGDFLLGVECDGATYHSSKSARDRDRLREEVIRSRGWQLHRIWSTDWFVNQRHEEERLRRALTEIIQARSLA